jgi:serralysin
MPNPLIIKGDNNPNTLWGTPGVDHIYGYGGNDTLFGYGGDDIIDGGTGADTMTGGIGNDKYYVDSAFDTVVELAGAGQGDEDTIYTSVTYNISANVENLVMDKGAGNIDAFGNSLDNDIHGNDGDNSIWGGGGADTIWGAGGNDHLYGGNGDDSLIGGEGADVMRGGRDNDSYHARNEDTIIENANEGWDHVYVLDSYTLGANLEELTIQGHWGGSGTLEGNELHNVINGNSGDSRIDGRGGADDLTGWNGNDTFVFRAGEANGDRVLDFNGNGAAAGDVLEFQGYGEGATLTQISATDWIISSADGSIHDTITLVGNPPVDPSDIHFV